MDYIVRYGVSLAQLSKLEGQHRLFPSQAQASAWMRSWLESTQALGVPCAARLVYQPSGTILLEVSRG